MVQPSSLAPPRYTVARPDAGITVKVVDMGCRVTLPALEASGAVIDAKVGPGTANMAEDPCHEPEQALLCIERGRQSPGNFSAGCLNSMQGIGNTTMPLVVHRLRDHGRAGGLLLPAAGPDLHDVSSAKCGWTRKAVPVFLACPSATGSTARIGASPARSSARRKTGCRCRD